MITLNKYDITSYNQYEYTSYNYYKLQLVRKLLHCLFLIIFQNTNSKFKIFTFSAKLKSLLQLDIHRIFFPEQAEQTSSRNAANVDANPIATCVCQPSGLSCNPTPIEAPYERPRRLTTRRDLPPRPQGHRKTCRSQWGIGTRQCRTKTELFRRTKIFAVSI